MADAGLDDVGAMHELSIANSLVDLATQSAADAGATRVTEVHIRLGALSGVVRSALEFCYPIAAAGTMVEGSALVVRELPVRIFCELCQKDTELASIQRFCCPECGTASGDVRQGRELDIEALELDIPDPE